MRNWLFMQYQWAFDAIRHLDTSKTRGICPWHKLPPASPLDPTCQSLVPALPQPSFAPNTKSVVQPGGAGLKLRAFLSRSALAGPFAGTLNL
jgi:hypothetical protein